MMRRLRNSTIGATLAGLLLACGAADPSPSAEQTLPTPAARVTSATPVEDAGSGDGRAGAPGPRTDAAEQTLQASNRPPEMVSIEIVKRDQARTGRDLLARTNATDPDDDAIAFEYRWSVNRRLVSDDGPTLSHDLFLRGDSVQLSVRASDGQDVSDWLRDEPFEVLNSPPRITSVPGDFDPDGTLRYRIEVDDPDGDRAYRYEIRKGPDGMAIDSVSGVLSWTPNPDQAGTHPVKFAVDDRRGGIGTQDFDVQVAFEETLVPAAPQP